MTVENVRDQVTLRRSRDDMEKKEEKFAKNPALYLYVCAAK